MAANGFSPSLASPAQKVTACCSAMPTSNTRPGKCFSNSVSPVPPPIAACTATTRSSSRASATSASAKNWVYEATGALAFTCAPVAKSNFATPWYRSCALSAGV